MGSACIVTEVCRGDDGAGATGSDGKILGRVNQAWAYQFGYIQSVVYTFIYLLVLFYNEQLHFDRQTANTLQIQAVKRSRGASWEEIRTRVDPTVKQKKGWTTPKL